MRVHMLDSGSERHLNVAIDGFDVDLYADGSANFSTGSSREPWLEAVSIFWYSLPQASREAALLPLPSEAKP